MTKDNSRLPDFLIVGAMKAGTTTLHYYLSKHPGISAARKKEPSFFTDKNWYRGIAWYQSLFKDNNLLKFEASTNYTKYDRSQSAPERIYNTIPNVKLIYIVRHPVKRAISQMHHMRVTHDRYNERITPKQLHESGSRPIALSQYYLQVSRYLRYFDLSRLHIICFEEMIANPSKVLNQTLQFLGLPGDFYKPEFRLHAFNTTSTSARVKYKKLHKYLAEANRHYLIPPLHKWLETHVPRPDVPLETQQYIWDAVADDLAQFEQLIGRSLGYTRPQ